MWTQYRVASDDTQLSVDFTILIFHNKRIRPNQLPGSLGLRIARDNRKARFMGVSYQPDKLFVDAVHVAIRNRYGALAAQASKKGEKIPFDRKFTRMRTGLMRAKNAQTLRAELADLFARGGLNSGSSGKVAGHLACIQQP